MLKIIAKWLEKYPLRTLFVGFCIIPFSFGIILILLPKGVDEIFGYCVIGVVFVILFIAFVKDKRAKKKLQK